MSKMFDRHPAQMLFGKIDDMLGRVGHGIEKARNYLFAQQHKDGYWCGELEADTTLESDYIAIHTLLGTGNRSRMERAVPEIIRHQNADGGWPIYSGGPSNISA
ncbi:MAG TPA: prenyltransferase/squalene oxidase repeat-containing protein, partial [Candidatus Angelobacter sp.]|nr:prenyltransferase/squalene oxidase repeat-containing protein [Candidatus Angelobacter sp.]